MLLSLHIYTFRPIKHFSFSDNEDVYCICKFNSLFMNSAHVFQKIFFFYLLTCCRLFLTELTSWSIAVLFAS